MRSSLSHAAFLSCLAVGISACSGGSSAPIAPFRAGASAATATPKSSAAPGGSATPTATPTTSTSSMTSAQINAAMAVVVAHWNATPLGGDLVGKENELAAYVKSQPGFSNAGVDPGGVWGTLSNGMTAIFYTDKVNDPSVLDTTAVAPIRQRALSAAAASTGGHQIDFFTLIGSKSFSVARPAAFAQTFQNSTFSNQYGVQFGTISLENLEAPSPPVDLLNLDTHGANAFVLGAGREQYVLSSATPINDATFYTYGPALVAGTLAIGAPLNVPMPGAVATATFSFTSKWLVNAMPFDSGAVVLVGACFSANPYPAGREFASDLTNAGVGVLMGWTKAVYTTDADETEAYIYDRLLGSNTLAALITKPPNAPQRPFQLSPILEILKDKPRTNPIQKTDARTTDNLATSTDKTNENAKDEPLSDGATAIFTVTGNALADDAVIAAPPTIRSISVQEEASPEPTLTIDGDFSRTPGKVFVGGGPNDTELSVISWSTFEIVARLPASAPSTGLVVAVEAGVASNPVPLTLWNVKYVLTKNYTYTGFYPSVPGTGSLSYTATLNVNFRAGVNAYTTSLDGGLLQPDFVAVPTRSSTGQIVAMSGGVHSTNQAPNYARNVTFTSNGPIALTPLSTLRSQNKVSADFFEVSPAATVNLAATKAGCNYGGVGSVGGSNPGTYCEAIQAGSDHALTCSDDAGGSYCDRGQNMPTGAGFDSSFNALPGAFELVLDPSYNLTSVINAPPDVPVGGYLLGSSTTTWNVTSGPPSTPPDNMTPAARRRAR